MDNIEPPSWLLRTHTAMTAVMLGAIVATCAIPLDERVAADVRIYANHRVDVSSADARIVADIEVRVGYAVEPGTLLVRFFSDGRADSSNGWPVLFSPTAGRISDIAVRPGTHVGPGQRLISIIDPSLGFEAVIDSPVAATARLIPGSQVDIEVEGFARARLAATIREVGLQVRPHREDGSGGPTTAVYASVTGSSVQFNGGYQPIRDGMTGTVRLAIGRMPLVVRLVPALRSFLS